MWLIYAVGSAVFAGITSILAKCGIQHTDSDIATALRTIVVVLFSWLMVLIVGTTNQISTISLTSWLFLILSGFATGASWLCYFKALSIGDINKVVPIDKSSTVLTIILGIIIFKEKISLTVFIALGCLFLGALLMISKKEVEANENYKNSWLVYAILSALFASLTSILGKLGVSGVESNLGSAIRTVVVLVMAWVVVFVKGKQSLIKNIPAKELGFIILSGVATGASWLCYYRALKDGNVSVVVPIDKLSILISIAFGYFVFGEKLTKKSATGLALMVIGTLLMLVK